MNNEDKIISMLADLSVTVSDLKQDFGNRLDKMDARLDKMDVRLDKMDVRLDNLETEVQSIKGDLAEVKVTQNLHTIKLDRIYDKSSSVLKKQIEIDFRFDQRIRTIEKSVGII